MKCPHRNQIPRKYRREMTGSPLINLRRTSSHSIPHCWKATKLKKQSPRKLSISILTWIDWSIFFVTTRKSHWVITSFLFKTTLTQGSILCPSELSETKTILTSTKRFASMRNSFTKKCVIAQTKRKGFFKRTLRAHLRNWMTFQLPLHQYLSNHKTALIFPKPPKRQSKRNLKSHKKPC